MDLKLLKEERVKKGFTQQYMAEQLGFKDRSSYCLIEKGNVSVNVDVADKIASILNLTKEKTFEIFFTT